jgi:hypothetical protein
MAASVVEAWSKRRSGEVVVAADLQTRQVTAMQLVQGAAEVLEVR